MSGVLIPGNAETPINQCTDAIPPESGVLFLGNSVYFTRQLSFSILEVRGKDFISIEKIGDGIYLSADIFSSDKRIIAQIRRNQFDINPNNYFRLERPNTHSLAVYDQQAKIVLNVDYINYRAIKLLGIFHIPIRDRSPIIIKEDEQIINGVINSEACLGNLQVGGTAITVN
jgi:hypothetical protein